MSVCVVCGVAVTAARHSAWDECVCVCMWWACTVGELGARTDILIRPFLAPLRCPKGDGRDESKRSQWEKLPWFVFDHHANARGV